MLLFLLLGAAVHVAAREYDRVLAAVQREVQQEGGPEAAYFVMQRGFVQATIRAWPEVALISEHLDLARELRKEVGGSDRGRIVSLAEQMTAKGDPWVAIAPMNMTCVGMFVGVTSAEVRRLCLRREDFDLELGTGTAPETPGRALVRALDNVTRSPGRDGTAFIWYPLLDSMPGAELIHSSWDGEMVDVLGLCFSGERGVVRVDIPESEIEATELRQIVGSSLVPTELEIDCPVDVVSGLADKPLGRKLQESKVEGKGWVARPKGRAETVVGLYDPIESTFEPVRTYQGLAFSSSGMWVDEKGNRIVVAYEGDLLALPFSQ